MKLVEKELAHICAISCIAVKLISLPYDGIGRCFKLRKQYQISYRKKLIIESVGLELTYFKALYYNGSCKYRRRSCVTCFILDVGLNSLLENGPLLFELNL